MGLDRKTDGECVLDGRSEWNRLNDPRNFRVPCLAVEQILKALRFASDRILILDHCFFFHPILQYQFSTANFKTSTKKLRLLANQIKGLDIQNAINQMEFSQKRPGKRVMNTLAFARTNATTQEKYAMDASKLYVGKRTFSSARCLL